MFIGRESELNFLEGKYFKTIVKYEYMQNHYNFKIRFVQSYKI